MQCKQPSRPFSYTYTFLLKKFKTGSHKLRLKVYCLTNRLFEEVQPDQFYHNRFNEPCSQCVVSSLQFVTQLKLGSIKMKIVCKNRLQFIYLKKMRCAFLYHSIFINSKLSCYYSSLKHKWRKVENLNELLDSHLKIYDFQVHRQILAYQYLNLYEIPLLYSYLCGMYC